MLLHVDVASGKLVASGVACLARSPHFASSFAINILGTQMRTPNAKQMQPSHAI